MLLALAALWLMSDVLTGPDWPDYPAPAKLDEPRSVLVEGDGQIYEAASSEINTRIELMERSGEWRLSLAFSRPLENWLAYIPTGTDGIYRHRTYIVSTCGEEVFRFGAGGATVLVPGIATVAGFSTQEEAESVVARLDSTARCDDALP